MATKHVFSWPVYDTMRACASATAIPIDVLKSAKSDGCPAFKHGRVDLQMFIEWFFNKGSDGPLDWTRENRRMDFLLKEVELAVKKGESIDFSLASRFIKEFVGQLFFGELDRLANYLPPALKGKTERQIEAEVLTQKAAIVKVLRDALKSWEKGTV